MNIFLQRFVLILFVVCRIMLWGSAANAAPEIKLLDSVSPESPTARKYVERGIFESKQQDWSVAISNFTLAINLDPREADAYQYRGDAYFANREIDKAISDYGQAIKLNTTNIVAYINRATAHYSKGDFSRAVADYNRYIELNPNDAYSHMMRAVCFKQQGKFDKAEQDYLEAIRLDPKSPYAYNGLADLKATCLEAKRRDGKEAVELASKACELSNWSDWTMIDTLAAAYAEKGDFKKAVEFQEKALALASLDHPERLGAEHRLSLYKEKKREDVPEKLKE